MNTYEFKCIKCFLLNSNLKFNILNNAANNSLIIKMAMNSSKSMNMLRPHSGAPAPLQDRTSFYNNVQVGQVGILGGGGQTQKNST
jgi:hypothetical protein